MVILRRSKLYRRYSNVRVELGLASIPLIGALPVQMKYIVRTENYIGANESFMLFACHLRIHPFLRRNGENVI